MITLFKVVKMNVKVILSLIGLFSSNLYAELAMVSSSYMKYRHCKMLGYTECFKYVNYDYYDNDINAHAKPLVNPSDSEDSEFTDLQSAYNEIFGLPPATNSLSHDPDPIEPTIMARNNNPVQNTPSIKVENDVTNKNESGDDYRFQSYDVMGARFTNFLVRDNNIGESINSKATPSSINIEINTTKTDGNNTVTAEHNPMKDQNKTTKTENNTIIVDNSMIKFDNNINIKMGNNQRLSRSHVMNKIEDNTRTVENKTITAENNSSTFENNKMQLNSNRNVNMEKNKGQSSFHVTYTIFFWLVGCRLLA